MVGFQLKKKKVLLIKMIVNIYDENGLLLDTISSTTLPDLKEEVYNRYNRNRDSDNTYRYVSQDNTTNFDLHPENHKSAIEYILKPLQTENETKFRYNLQKWLEKKLKEIHTREEKLDTREKELATKKDELEIKEGTLRSIEIEIERERKRLFLERKRFYFAKKKVHTELETKFSKEDLVQLDLDAPTIDELRDKEYYQLYDWEDNKKEYQSSYELKKDIFNQKHLYNPRKVETGHEKKVVINLENYPTIDALLGEKLFNLQNIQKNLQLLSRQRLKQQPKGY